MSAEVLASAAAAEAKPLSPAPRLEAALFDAGLLNRLLGVATALFAVPVGVELHVLLAHSFAGTANAPSAAAATSTLLAAALFAAGFGALLLRAPRTPDLRAARVLACVLALEAAALAAALALRLAA